MTKQQTKAVTKPSDNGRIASEALETELSTWLSEHNAAIAVVALSPSGQAIPIQDILAAGVLQAGWQVAYKPVRIDGNH